MENMWPIVDDIKTTEEVLPFLESTINELKNCYQGKIKARICPMQYTSLKNIQLALSTFSNTAKSIESQINRDTYKENLDIEKDRKQADITNCDYKYEIFNDHLYYKLFTISISEFYPIKIQISAGILCEDDVEMKISDINKLKNIFSKIVYTDKVKMIIQKMISSVNYSF